MEYELHCETADGASVETIFSPSVADAYDACEKRLSEHPDAIAVHLHLGPRRLHTVRPRTSGLRRDG